MNQGVSQLMNQGVSQLDLAIKLADPLILP